MKKTTLHITSIGLFPIIDDMKKKQIAGGIASILLLALIMLSCIGFSGFGMLLRNSPYKGNTAYAGIISLAENALGADQYGYRKNFVALAKKAKTISEKNTDKE